MSGMDQVYRNAYSKSIWLSKILPSPLATLAASIRIPTALVTDSSIGMDSIALAISSLNNISSRLIFLLYTLAIGMSRQTFDEQLVK